MAQTPLHVSAGNNRADVVKFLLGWQGPEKVELEAKNMVSGFKLIATSSYTKIFFGNDFLLQVCIISLFVIYCVVKFICPAVW